MSQMRKLSDNPYVGPRTFERNEGHLFFGREREGRDLLSLVISERLVLLYGPSGGGKSSLINTRLIPGLEEKGFEVLPKGRVGGTAPAEAPVDNIFVYNLLLSLSQEEAEALPLRDANMTIKEFLWQFGAEDATPDANTAAAEVETEEQIEYDIWPRALIIDQFEEILVTNLQAWDKRDAFFRQIADALAEDEYLWVILVIREDYVAGLEPYTHLLPGKLKARFYLEPMGFDGAMQAVTGPVAERRPFDEGAAKELVDNLRQIQPHEQEDLLDPALGQYVKPVQLQVVCYQLWEDLRQHPGERITHHDLRRLAGGQDLARFVDQALGKFYEQAITQVAEDKPGRTELDLRNWFEHKLITKGGTRAPVLREARETGGLDNEVVSKLDRLFLLRSEARAGDHWYELVHDRLIPPILQSNAAWRREHPLIEDAQRWEDAGQPEELLYRGKQLEVALEHPEAEIPVVRAFLDKGQEAKRQRAQARRYQRLGLIVGVLLILVIVAAVIAALAVRSEQATEVERLKAVNSHRTAVVSYGTATAALGTAEAALDTAEDALGLAHRESTAVVQQRDRATEAEATAEAAEATAKAALDKYVEENRRYNALDLAEAAKRSLGVDLDLSLLLAVQAVRSSPNGGAPPLIEVEDALQQAVLSARGEATMLLGRAERVGELVLDAHDYGTYGVDWSPDGATVAVAGAEGTVVLFEAATGEERSAFPAHDAEIIGMDFSPDGKNLVTGSVDGTARVWDVNSGELLMELVGHETEVYHVAWSPDGATLATAGDDGKAVLWRAATGEQLDALGGDAGPTIGVAFSPDGQQLATSGLEGTVRVWDVDSGELVLDLVGYDYGVYDVDWSPDGATLVTAGEQGEAILWDATTGEELLRLLGPEGEVYGATFSPDGRYVATADEDGTAWLWDASTGREVRSLEGDEYPIFDLAFSPDGTQLATASVSGAVRVWDIAGQELERHAPRFTYLDFGRDGTRLSVAREDGVISVWDIPSGARVQAITATEEITITGAVLGPDGQDLLAAVGEALIRVWDADSGQEVHGPDLEHREIFTSIVKTALSGDGSRLAAVSRAGTIGVWDLASGQLQWSLQIREPEPDIKASEGAGAESQAPEPTPEPGTPRPESSRTQRLPDIGGRVHQLVLDEHGTRLAVAIESQRAADTESQLAPELSYAVQVWDVDAAEEMPARVFEGRIQGLALSPKGDLAAVTTASGNVEVWDAGTRQEALVLGHVEPVDALAFDPEGARLATATWQEIKLWDVANREGKSVTLPAGVSVWDLAFSPDGSYLAAAALDGTVHLFALDMQNLLELACQTVTRNVTQVEWETHERAIGFPQICPQQPLHETVILELVRKGEVQEARNFVTQAGYRARAAGYELDIAPNDALAGAYIDWAEQLADLGDYADAREKLDQASQIASPFTAEQRTEAASVSFLICRKETERDLRGRISPACERVAGLAREIALGERVSGIVESEVGDVWAFAGERGQLVTIAMDRASPELDPYISLFDSEVQDLAWDDDSGGSYNARIMGYRLPVDGTYLLNTRDFGGTRGAYTLTLYETEVKPIAIGDTVAGNTRDGVIWNLAGGVGQVVQIGVDHRIDLELTASLPDGTIRRWPDNSGSLLVRLSLPVTGTYSLLVASEQQRSGPYTLTLSAASSETGEVVELPEGDEEEPTVEPVSGLGRSLGEQVDRYYAGQAFQHGFMFWRDNAAAAPDWIYVIQWGPGDDPTAGLFWARFDDTWTDDTPEYFCDQAAAPYGPRRGFGKVWCQRTEVRHALGGAIEREWGEHGGWQDFEQGVMLWDAENDRTFVLYEDGTWEAVSE